LSDIAFRPEIWNWPSAGEVGAGVCAQFRLGPSIGISHDFGGEKSVALVSFPGLSGASPYQFLGAPPCLNANSQICHLLFAIAA
jgi:hypothetical protein